MGLIKDETALPAIARVREAMWAKLPPPLPGSGDVVLEAMRDLPADDHLLWHALHARRLVGLERYGSPLQRRNGRSFLVDAAQEVVDLVAYLHGADDSAEIRAARHQAEQLARSILQIVGNTSG
jgi:hypothetical protein